MRMTWPADKIRAEMKRTDKPFVMFDGVYWKNLHRRLAETLDGDYRVENAPHEIRVWDNYRRRKSE